MEKSLRVLGSDEDSGGHSHHHHHHHQSHSQTEDSQNKVLQASGADTRPSDSGLKSRSSGKPTGSEPSQTSVPKQTTSPSKLSAYLNLFGDFVHNM